MVGSETLQRQASLIRPAPPGSRNSWDVRRRPPGQQTNKRQLTWMSFGFHLENRVGKVGYAKYEDAPGLPKTSRNDVCQSTKKEKWPNFPTSIYFRRFSKTSLLHPTSRHCTTCYKPTAFLPGLVTVLERSAHRHPANVLRPLPTCATKHGGCWLSGVVVYCILYDVLFFQNEFLVSKEHVWKHVENHANFVKVPWNGILESTWPWRVKQEVLAADTANPQTPSSHHPIIYPTCSFSWPQFLMLVLSVIPRPFSEPCLVAFAVFGWLCFYGWSPATEWICQTPKCSNSDSGKFV